MATLALSPQFPFGKVSYKIIFLAFNLCIDISPGHVSLREIVRIFSLFDGTNNITASLTGMH
jgi:hypothetical protein